MTPAESYRAALAQFGQDVQHPLFGMARAFWEGGLFPALLLGTDGTYTLADARDAIPPDWVSLPWPAGGTIAERLAVLGARLEAKLAEAGR